MGKSHSKESNLTLLSHINQTVQSNIDTLSLVLDSQTSRIKDIQRIVTTQKRELNTINEKLQFLETSVSSLCLHAIKKAISSQTLINIHRGSTRSRGPLPTLPKGSNYQPEPEPTYMEAGTSQETGNYVNMDIN